MKIVSYLILLIVLCCGCSSESSQQPKSVDKKIEAIESATDSMLVMTYNICWSCMTRQDTEDPTGIDTIDLAPTTCLDNLAAFVDSVPAALGYANYDFVGTQESSGIYDVQRKSSSTLGQMNMIYKSYDIRDTISEMATFYNRKYTLTDTVCGLLKNGRPAQILIFQDSLIFINIHNCHGRSCDTAFLARRLSQMLSRKGYSSTRLHELATYRIIVTGDFNYGYRRPMQLRPFSHLATIPTTCRLDNPPISCCSPRSGTCDELAVPWNSGGSNRPGDLIFDSDVVVKPFVPSDYNKSIRCSDHLPVVASLPKR